MCREQNKKALYFSGTNNEMERARECGNRMSILIYSVLSHLAQMLECSANAQFARDQRNESENPLILII